MNLEVDADVRRPNGFHLRVRICCETPSLGLVGPSGSGKSTLLDAIAGIEPGARVVLDGRDLSRVPLHRRGVGYLAQDALLFPHLSVRRNLSYSPDANSIEEVASAVGISHLLDRMPRHLSGGERRRAALARAIVGRPRLLLLDEPFAGLDEARSREAVQLVRRVMLDYRIPLIVVSHRAEEVLGVADHAIRLEEGRVRDSGPSAALLRAAPAADGRGVDRSSDPGAPS